MLQDPLPLLVALLACVPVKRHRRRTTIAVLQELAQLLQLAIRERVHRVHDDRPDTLAATLPQHAVHDWHDVGERLARPGARGQHVRSAGTGGADSLGLVAVQGN